MPRKAYPRCGLKRKDELITRKGRLLFVCAAEVPIKQGHAACFVCDEQEKESLYLWPIICRLYASILAQKTVRGWRMRSPSSKINGMTLLKKSWCHFEVLLCVALAIRIKLFPPIRAFLFFQVI